MAFGNEGSPDVVERFSRRFGVHVIDAFGATEGGIAVNRRTACPAGALGRAGDGIQVVDEDGHAKPGRPLRRRRPPPQRRGVRRRDRQHRRARALRGLLQQRRGQRGARPATAGTGRATSATSTTTGYLYFAGRNADWIRVDGENFPAGPIETAVASHPDVVVAAVYGVPDVTPATR